MASGDHIADKVAGGDGPHVHLSVPRSYSAFLLNDCVRGSEDADSAFAVSPYAEDVFEHLLALEREQCIRPGFLCVQENIRDPERADLADWLCQLRERLDCEEETVYLAVNLMDRYLQDVPTSVDQLYVLGAAAFFSAAKYEEQSPPTVDQLAQLVPSAFSRPDLLAMERSVLATVDWCLGWPSPLHFLRIYAKKTQPNENEFYLAKFALYASLLDHEASAVLPSKLAAAALCLAVKLLDGAWDDNYEQRCRLSENQLAAPVKILAWNLLNAQEGRHRTAYKRYSSGACKEIARTTHSVATKLREIFQS